ncbi:MAG: tetratricopeptide repeat protein [Nitrospirae bacterium]|nr:tetratricopeptide repeat protein [Nitrospirota bacterium]
MAKAEAEKLYCEGADALDRGNTLFALACFEKAVQKDDHPLYSSCLAYCIAKERGQFQMAISLCKRAIALEPDRSAHYLNLGRIYLMTGDKPDAISTFRDGLRNEANTQIIAELDRLGTRKAQVISFLKRSNPINIYLGYFLKRIGLR